jgi:hypothetical protein
MVSQENWPATRVRNIVKEFETQRARQFMPLRNPPPKRMSREKGLEWLATTAGIPLDDLKLARPVQFVHQYVLGSCEHHALVQAVRIVHGITANALYSPADKDCAKDWMLQLAREQLLESLAAPAEAPAEVAPRRSPYDDADDNLFEPPPVQLPTLTEAAERLASLREQLQAHVEEREAEATAEADIAEQRRFEDRAALNRLSDRLVSSEMELGLIDDALDHMYAGQQSPANVVGRLAKIIARITAMDI